MPRPKRVRTQTGQIESLNPFERKTAIPYIRVRNRRATHCRIYTSLHIPTFEFHSSANHHSPLLAGAVCSDVLGFLLAKSVITNCAVCAVWSLI